MSELQEEGVQQYRPLSAMAILGLAFGLLAAAALLDPAAWIFPPIGLMLSGWALWRISHGTATMLGRKAALCGLLLSILFGAAAASQYYATRWLLCCRARDYALVWFDAIRYRQSQVVYALTLPPSVRQSADAKSAESDKLPSQSMSMADYLDKPVVKTLLSFGEHAEVRYCGTESIELDQRSATVHQLFAVTARQPDGETTFRVDVTLQRVAVGQTGLADWYIANATGDKEPQSVPGR